MLPGVVIQARQRQGVSVRLTPAWSAVQWGKEGDFVSKNNNNNKTPNNKKNVFLVHVIAKHKMSF